MKNRISGYQVIRKWVSGAALSKVEGLSGYQVMAIRAPGYQVVDIRLSDL